MKTEKERMPGLGFKLMRKFKRQVQFYDQNYLKPTIALTTGILLFTLATIPVTLFSQTINNESLWNKKYDFIYDFPPILFHYHHGILAGSYPPDQETTEISFNDVSCFLGHVCLCGAGGYRISHIATDLMKGTEKSLERGEFTLISSRDHTVSDVIAYVLGCSRRNDTEKNHYFIDETINAPKRVYHYYIGYHSQQKAVHIMYNKYLLIGNERMDKLWKVELAFDKDPDSVNQADVKLYQDTMFDVVKDVLLDQKKGLFEVNPIEYDEFLSRISRLKKRQPATSNQ